MASQELEPSPADQVRWERVRRLANLLDSAFRVPGTSWRFGVDGLVGLVPGIGDAAGLLASAVVVGQGVLLGARGWTLTGMLLLVSADALLGAVPIVGAVFDFAFKANRRALALLEEHARDPAAARTRARRTVLWSLGAVAATTIVLATLLIVGAVFLVSRLT